MSAQIIDGKAIAAEVRGEVAAKVAELKSKGITYLRFGHLRFTIFAAKIRNIFEIYK